MRRPTVPLLVASALAALIASSPSGFAQKDAKQLPVAPEEEYFRRKELMAKGMMPNYKALWSAFQANDAKSIRTAAAYIEKLGRSLEKFPPPSDKGNPAEYPRHSAELQKRSVALAAAAGDGFDKSVVHGKILALYASCQGCHDDFAPEEGTERRKYSPPA